MPVYQLKNIETSEIFEKTMKISEYVEYLKENPNIHRHFESGNSAMVCDPTRLMDGKFSKGDPTFQKYIINRIRDSVPGNTLKDRKFNTNREW